MKKLLVSDYDKTLKVHYDFTHDIFMKINVKSIKRFIQNGNFFMLNTGRAFDSIKKEIVDNKIPYNYLVCNDGTLLLDNKDNVVRMYDLSNPQYNYEELITYLKRNNINSIVVDNSIIINKDEFDSLDNLADDFYLNYNIVDNKVILSPKSFDEIMINFITKYPEFKLREWKHNNILLEYEIYRNNPKIIFSLYKDKTGMLDDIKRITNLYNIQLAIFMERIIYLRHKDITKSTMIEETSKILDIKHDDIYTVGDNYNDLQMIKDYHGYTMPWGKKVLKEECEGITSSVNRLIKRIERW